MKFVFFFGGGKYSLTLLHAFKSAFRVAISVLSKSKIIVEKRFVN